MVRDIQSITWILELLNLIRTCDSFPLIGSKESVQRANWFLWWDMARFLPAMLKAKVPETSVLTGLATKSGCSCSPEYSHSTAPVLRASLEAELACDSGFRCLERPGLLKSGKECELT